ncbi:DUF2461 family protein [Streptomyces sp. NPDC101209]|uniref:DUF2461 family protein n=1 Tax=Streptomyces sp. NPDC101209 TaxID=3366129 RepID=UPI00382971AF
MVIRLGCKIEIGLWFDLDGLRIQGAWWYPGPGQVDVFRKAVASEGRRELFAIVEDVRKKGSDISGDVMKRPPRGFPTDHSRTDLLRHRSLIAARPSAASSGCSPQGRSTGFSRPSPTWTPC